MVLAGSEQSEQVERQLPRLDHSSQLEEGETGMLKLQAMLVARQQCTQLVG